MPFGAPIMQPAAGLFRLGLFRLGGSFRLCVGGFGFRFGFGFGGSLLILKILAEQQPFVLIQLFFAAVQIYCSCGQCAGNGSQNGDDGYKYRLFHGHDTLLLTAALALHLVL